ncbi:MAG: aldo/keto reductase [Phycisphaerales bacterium]|nr:MAG: aldo/keto reductase [Phycisphaerales bacterium]
MERRRLGDSELEVSALALGTWAMGATVETWGCVDDGESIASIQEALDCGINLIDTAPIYGLGHSEEIVGKAIQGRRDEVLLATKCGLLFPKSENELPPRCLAPESILRECEASLRRLRTEYIDLYQCHWPDPDVPVRETMGALTALLEQGKIRALGVSNFGIEEIASAREFGPICASQPAFSILQPRAAQDLIPYCIEHDMGVLPYSPLAKGLLTGKFDEDSKLEGVRTRDPEFIGARYRRNLSLVASLKEIAQRYDKTVAQLAINWTANHPGVTAPIVGAKRPSQVIENAGGVGWTLTDEDRARIDELVRDT